MLNGNVEDKERNGNWKCLLWDLGGNPALGGENPAGEGWEEMILKLLSNPNRSVIPMLWEWDSDGAALW